MKKIIILVILLIIATAILAVNTVTGDEGNKIQIKNILGLEKSSYKYNTLCDITSDPDQYASAFITAMFGMKGGMHNDNKYLIQFFKTDELMSKLGFTPDMVFGIEDKREDGRILARNYDPIFYDTAYWSVPIWHIMGINPEIVNLLTSMRDGTPLNMSYLEMQTEFSKCQ